MGKIKFLGAAHLKNSVAYNEGNTGNGDVTGITAAMRAATEDWTLVCTTEAENGGTFSVTGSVSNAQADATVGDAYDNGIVQFTINDGDTDWKVGDTIIVSILRAYQENTFDSKTTSIQTIISGDLTKCNFDIKSCYNTSNKFSKVDSVTLSSDNITAGGIINTVNKVVGTSLIVFTDIDVTNECTAKVYCYAE